MEKSFWSEPIIIYDEPHGSEIVVIDQRPGRPKSRYVLDLRTLDVDPALHNEPELIECLRLNGWFANGVGKELAARHGWITPHELSPTQLLVSLESALVERLRGHVVADERAIELLSPHAFELVIAELLRDMGYDVELTPETRDGGRDILAFATLPPGLRCVILVECKKWHRERKIGIGVVKQFLMTVREQDRATRGLIVTTSSFSAPAHNVEHAYRNIVSLHNHSDVREWLGRYGTWRTSTTQGLWLPSRTTFRSV